MIGKCAYHMKKCKKKISNYRPSIILYTLIEELRVVKGLLTYVGFLSDDFVNSVTGNFNCTMNTKMDKLGGNPNARHSAVLALNDVSTRYDLIDIWTLRHRHERNFTWAGKNPADTSFIIRTRIYFFLDEQKF